MVPSFLTFLSTSNISSKTRANEAFRSKQLDKWADYSVALNSLIGPTSDISEHSVIQTDRDELANL